MTYKVVHVEMWIFSNQSQIAILTFVLGAQKNRLFFYGSFEYPEHMFWLINKKNYF